ncbi:MAG: CAP domain-containing protein [Solirubrobacterales bacterium]
MWRPRNILSLIALVATWTLVASGSASAADCGPVDTQVTGLNEAQMESSITCLINDERTSRGLQPVSSNDDLRRAAVSHSNEMIDQGYFEHTSPAGLTFMDRIESTGYMRGARSWTVGENLVWGTGPLSTPQALVTAWMNSPPHRQNLLRPTFRELGVAALTGTPVSRSDQTGTTVSSEYGYRTFATKKSARKAHKAHRARKARKARKGHKRHKGHKSHKSHKLGKKHRR